MDIALWIVTGILAVAFFIAGFIKTFRAKSDLASAMAWTEDYSARTVKLIGVAEMLGAIGLVLPWITGIATILTPLAAFALVVVQALAISVHIRRHEQKIVPVNVVLLLLTVFVAVGRFIQFSGTV